MSSRTTARHRKATRALTPLDDFAPTARRGLAVAASSGLALTMMASGANAAGHTEVTSSGTIEASGVTPGVGIFAANAREALAARQQVTMSQVNWVTEAAPEVEAVAPAPAAPQTPAAPEAPAAQAEQTSSEAAAPAAPSSGNSIVGLAMAQVGKAYVYGAGGPSAFDCSGLVSYVYANVAGISVPHSSGGIRSAGTVISASEAQPGDVIWWPGHVAIYAGDGMMVSAESESVGVQYLAVRGGATYLRF